MGQRDGSVDPVRPITFLFRVMSLCRCLVTLWDKRLLM